MDGRGQPGRCGTRLAALAGLLLACAAEAHPQGFHERLTITVAKRSLTALVVMDVDAGDRCRLLRAGADEDRDGTLSEGEKAALRAKLVSMATKGLRLAVSGFALEPTVKASKLSLRDDPRASDAGLSLAALVEVSFPKDATPGMSLEVEATSPDLSTVVIDVFQSGDEAPARVEADSGKKARFRLGVLTQAPPAP